MVEPGDLLFVIDDRPYQAELARAQAELAQAQAQQRFAANDLQRLERLRQSAAAAELELLEARRAAEQADAAVAAAKAAVEIARLNVEWCQVRAPIAGRIGRRLVTVGNLISGGQGQATLLTTITSLDPIYCYFDVDERSLRRYQRLVRVGARPSASRLPVELTLVDETEFRHRGYVDFVDNRLDPATGTITMRGVFPNPTRQLLPGFFARVRLPAREAFEATLVPEEAVGTNLAQQYVLVVDAENQVRMRPVTTGKTYFGLREVQGVRPTDRVIVKGLVQARPGATVQPLEVPIQVAQTRPEDAPPYFHPEESLAETQPEDALAARLGRQGQGSGGSVNGPGPADTDGGSGAEGRPGSRGAEGSDGPAASTGAASR